MSDNTHTDAKTSNLKSPASRFSGGGEPLTAAERKRRAEEARVSRWEKFRSEYPERTVKLAEGFRPSIATAT